MSDISRLPISRFVRPLVFCNINGRAVVIKTQHDRITAYKDTKVMTIIFKV